MNVSPLDLRQAKFNTAMRGFDKIEVTSFLMAAAEDYELALRDTDRMRQDLARLDVIVSEYREHEKTLKSTLMAAQKLADGITGNAEAEARRIIADAQGRSDLLLEKAQARLEEVRREIDELKLKRRDAETSLEATIQTLRHTLQFLREQDARDREDRQPQRPRVDADGGSHEAAKSGGAMPSNAAPDGDLAGLPQTAHA